MLVEYSIQLVQGIRGPGAPDEGILQFVVRQRLPSSPPSWPHNCAPPWLFFFDKHPAKSLNIHLSLDIWASPKSSGMVPIE
jgi:hypothetical protein